MKKDKLSLAGNNIYLDRYGDRVYYNVFDKNGYIVSEQVEQKFKLFYHRYSTIFIVIILLGDYFNSFQNTLLVGLGAGVLVELYFRFIFLKKLKVVKNFKRERKTSKLESLINSKEKEKVIMKACAYVLLSILIILNSIQQNFDTILITLSIIGSLYSFYIGVLNLIAFIKMKKCQLIKK